MPDQPTIYGPAVGYDLRGYLIQRAAQCMGVAADQLLCDFHDHATKGENGLSFTTAAGGTRTYISKALRLNSAGGAGGTAFLTTSPSLAGSYSQKFLTGAQKYFFAAEFAISAVSTTGICLVGPFTNAGEQLAVGGRGPTSATNFVLFGSAGTPITGAALDTNYHVHQFWNDGSGGAAPVHWIMDSNAQLDGNPTPANAATVAAEAFDSAAVSRTLDIKWWFAAAPK